MKCVLFIFAVLLAIIHVDSFAEYVPLLPNGARVPNPCVPRGLWAAAGHTAIAGGGNRNQFGIDFAANFYVWTPALCRADSDGDGVRNGVELGDPNCRWIVGQRPQRAATGHPGICEPINSVRCRNRPTLCI